jgi:hypothetical protein
MLTVGFYVFTYSYYTKKAPALKTRKVVDKLAPLGLPSKPGGRKVRGLFSYCDQA